MNHHLEMALLIIKCELTGPQEAKDALMRYILEYGHQRCIEGIEICGKTWESVFNESKEKPNNVGTETDYNFAKNL